MVLPHDGMPGRSWAALHFLPSVLERQRKQFERTSHADVDRVHDVLLVAALVRATVRDLIAAIGVDHAARSAALEDLKEVRAMLDGAHETLTQLTKDIEHLSNMILFEKTDADRVAIVQNPRCPDASLRNTIDCPTLVAAVERLHSHSVYKPDYIARLLSDCGLPAVLSDDSTAVLVGDYRLESIEPEWGDPGISALAVLDFAYRLILQTEPRSDMIGRGFWFRDVLGKLKIDVGSSDSPSA